MLLILIPVIIAIDTGEKIDKFLRNPDLTLAIILKDYYVNFIVTIGNMILPMALFVSVLFFTSKLAGNTEVVAINSSQISFSRFLFPYWVGATIVTLFALSLNHFIVPQSSKAYNEFYTNYIRTSKKINKSSVTNVNLQINENEYIYIKSYNLERNIGVDFNYEIYEGTALKEKITADRIEFRPKDTLYKMTNYFKRVIGEETDSVAYERKAEMKFNFKPSDLLHIDSFAKEMQTPELLDYINFSIEHGRANLNVYYVELYKRTSLPIASYILTIIAAALGSVKRRGGIGLNLAIGMTMAFIYVFLLKIVEVVGATPNSYPLFMVWLPNVIFSGVAIYLYIKAKN